MKKSKTLFLIAAIAAAFTTSVFCVQGAEALPSEEAKADEAVIDHGGTEEVRLANTGITLHLPGDFKDTKGIVEYDDGELDDGVLMAIVSYSGVTQEWLDSLGAEVSEEDQEKYYGSTFYLLTLFGIDQNRSAAELADAINEAVGSQLVEEGDLTVAGQDQDVTYYFTKALIQEDRSSLEPEYAEEFDHLLALTDSVVENAGFKKPKELFEGTVGSTVVFETTDLDGNKVTSEELFAKHKVTMINVWATWCIWCKEELPDLERINAALEEKDCAIIGLLGDGDSANKIELGKSLLEEKGVTYLNILPYDGWQDIFDMRAGWPTSFLVDSEGRIIADPIVGANVAHYEELVLAALEGSASDAGESAAEESAAEDADAQEAGAEEADAEDTASSDPDTAEASADAVYRIIVLDEDSNPVEGTMVQFCTDEICKVAATDADGAAVFEEVPGVYEVHILKAPEGFKADETVYHTEDQYGDMTITLEKE